MVFDVQFIIIFKFINGYNMTNDYYTTYISIVEVKIVGDANRSFVSFLAKIPCQMLIN